MAAECEGAEEVTILSYDPSRVVVKASLGAQGYLVLTDPYYPGWRARVDGEERPIHRADYLFRAVQLDAGEHIVEWVYAPPSLRLGLILSLISLSVLTLAPLVWTRGIKMLYNRDQGGGER